MTFTNTDFVFCWPMKTNTEWHPLGVKLRVKFRVIEQVECKVHDQILPIQNKIEQDINK